MATTSERSRSSDPEPLSNDQPSTGPSTLTKGIIVVLSLVAIVAVWAVSSRAGSSSGPETGLGSFGQGDELTDFTFATADGETTTLAAHAGEPLVINYFAAWCPPCRAELPDFEEVHQEVGDEVTFVGVSRDNTTGAWLGLVEELGVSYETVYEGNVRGSFEFVQGRGMPTTVFVTADGEIAEVFSGALSADFLRQLIDEHLT